jgi:hypothetical protein
MSNELTPQEAVLIQKIYAPVFIQKCAELGVNIPDNESLDAALETAAYVKQMSASNTNNVIKQANYALKNMLGVHQAETAQLAETAVKEASYFLSGDPEIREAALASVLA